MRHFNTSLGHAVSQDLTNWQVRPRAGSGLVQRIGRAVSDDFITWTKDPDCLVEADPRWYELLAYRSWPDQAWRDPWVYFDERHGGYRMLITARLSTGIPDGRGVIDLARSTDLAYWEILPPVTDSGDCAFLEVAQLIELHGRWYLFYSVYESVHCAARQQHTRPVTGTHYFIADSPDGPFTSVTNTFLCSDPRDHSMPGGWPAGQP